MGENLTCPQQKRKFQPLAINRKKVAPIALWDCMIAPTRYDRVICFVLTAGNRSSMPTPFTHLVTCLSLLDDLALPAEMREFLAQERNAFSLGSVIPDARLPDVEDSRAATHFYKYTEPMTDHPWRIMLTRHPALKQPTSAAHRAFVAGYVAHLAMDEIWSLKMLVPYFADADWGDSLRARFFVLHLLLIDMDDRDYARLPTGTAAALHAADPANWLPFMPRSIIQKWQALIYDQIKPDGDPQTLVIFGERVRRSPEELRALVDDVGWMERELWQHVPRAALARVEVEMRDHARTALRCYMEESA